MRCPFSRDRWNHPMFERCNLHRDILVWRNSHWWPPTFHLYDFGSLNLYEGEKSYPAGRLNDPASPTAGKQRQIWTLEKCQSPHDVFLGLSHTLRSHNFKLGRLQTGTPARLDGRTINFVGLEKQDGDVNPQPFSFITTNIPNKVSVWFREVAFHYKHHPSRTINFPVMPRPQHRWLTRSFATICIEVYTFRKPKRVYRMKCLRNVCWSGSISTQAHVIVHPSKQK